MLFTRSPSPVHIYYCVYHAEKCICTSFDTGNITRCRMRSNRTGDTKYSRKRQRVHELLGLCIFQAFIAVDTVKPGWRFNPAFSRLYQWLTRLHVKYRLSREKLKTRRRIVREICYTLHPPKVNIAGNTLRCSMPIINIGQCLVNSIEPTLEGQEKLGFSWWCVRESKAELKLYVCTVKFLFDLYPHGYARVIKKSKIVERIYP